jgi:hypothetical protein
MQGEKEPDLLRYAFFEDFRLRIVCHSIRRKEKLTRQSRKLKQ